MTVFPASSSAPAPVRHSASTSGTARDQSRVDAIGGDRGVEVQGVLGVQGFIVTPHGSGMIGQLIEGVNHGVSEPVQHLGHLRDRPSDPSCAFSVDCAHGTDFMMPPPSPFW